MIVWFGEGDFIKERSAKLIFLQKLFGLSATPINFHRLKPGDLAPKTGPLNWFSKKETLIISGHGSLDTIGIYKASDIAGVLLKAGLSYERFDQIYLMNCFVGYQTQKNDVFDNFAKAFFRELNNPPTAGIKIYAPRGTIEWNTEDIRKEEHVWESVTGISIVTPEKAYSLKEGMLLVMG